MAKKKAFALRIDEDMLKAVEKWAADDFRSTNGQLEWIISKALKEEGRRKK
ncbi:MAG: Arc family DNA-binding protein [Owenweeksia sp.]|nr:Arc family DNA-binding protein [Owenweeksia sp.]